LGVFLTTTVDTVILGDTMLDYITGDLDKAERAESRINLITEVVAVVDGYLLASILLIFAFGSYELFIHKIEKAETSEIGARLLLIRSFDDLKDRLASVILLILLVKFFQLALKLKYETALDLLYLSIGIILSAGAVFLSGLGKIAKGWRNASKNPPEA
jgi:uncharacterized membrane protein YqhA